jgi:hypothetical protein
MQQLRSTPTPDTDQKHVGEFIPAVARVVYGESAGLRAIITRRIHA